MSILFVLFVLFCLTSIALWTVAYITAVKMTKYAKPGISRFYFATHPTTFFSGNDFTPDVAPHLRRLKIAIATCAVFVVATILVGLSVYGPSAGRRNHEQMTHGTGQSDR